jgi:acyl carrier protein
MTEDEIKSAVVEGLKRIAPESDPASLAPDANVRAALDIDSFDFLNFLIGLHQRLGVEIPEADYGKLTTIRDMVAYLKAGTGDTGDAAANPKRSVAG